ncbi:hypothetical protein BaRGS_00016004, partial [Batillaria attramentaria]
CRPVKTRRMQTPDDPNGPVKDPLSCTPGSYARCRIGQMSRINRCPYKGAPTP